MAEDRATEQGPAQPRAPEPGTAQPGGTQPGAAQPGAAGQGAAEKRAAQHSPAAPSAEPDLRPAAARERRAERPAVQRAAERPAASQRPALTQLEAGLAFRRWLAARTGSARAARPAVALAPVRQAQPRGATGSGRPDRGLRGTCRR